MFSTKASPVGRRRRHRSSRSATLALGPGKRCLHPTSGGGHGWPPATVRAHGGAAGGAARTLANDPPPSMSCVGLSRSRAGRGFPQSGRYYGSAHIAWRPQFGEPRQNSPFFPPERGAGPYSRVPSGGQHGIDHLKAPLMAASGWPCSKGRCGVPARRAYSRRRCRGSQSPCPAVERGLGWWHLLDRC